MKKDCSPAEHAQLLCLHSTLAHTLFCIAYAAVDSRYNRNPHCFVHAVNAADN